MPSRVRIPEEFIIQHLDSRVVLRLAQIIVPVVVVEDGGTDGTQINRRADVRRLNRLTATVDTAARATHDFDKLKIQLAGLNPVQQFLRLAGTGSDTDINSQVTKLIGRQLDTLGTAHLREIHGFQLGARISSAA